LIAYLGVYALDLLLAGPRPPPAPRWAAEPVAHEVLEPVPEAACLACEPCVCTAADCGQPDGVCLEWVRRFGRWLAQLDDASLSTLASGSAVVSAIWSVLHCRCRRAPTRGEASRRLAAYAQ
jgi:hypothetical protein